MRLFVGFSLITLIILCVESQKCGVPKIGIGNMFGGTFIDRRGLYPWHAALMKLDRSGKPSYLCGGTLISDKHVITAAHCIHNKESVPLSKDKILIYLGGHNLSLTSEEGRQKYSIAEIFIHPDWKYQDFRWDADLAMLELQQNVNFTTLIQPICLWDSETDPPDTSGVVVGYGRSEDKERYEDIPKRITMPIQTQEDCFLSNSALADISSKRTFCAGSANGTGVCLGDSGGGLIINFNNAFYLRGIVSASLYHIANLCDVDNYSIFTNVLKFKDWIRNFMIGIRKIGRYSECGIMSSSSGLIQKGKFSSRVQFPWMASIVKSPGLFNSSGALISHKHVITGGTVVAFLDKNQAKFVTLELYRFKIYLGSLQHVSDQNAFNAQEIILHPNIKVVDENRINNIAIITLSASVEFNDFIRPVCLWTFGNDLNLIKNLPLYAVGYGNDENGIVTNVRKHAKVTLVDQNVCEEKYSKFIPNIFSETKAFCVVGDASGSPCHLDECLFVKFNGKWFLRGIQSRLFYYPNRKSFLGFILKIFNIPYCVFDKPYLYEDIFHHVQWIQSEIKT